jgi:DNA-binding LytR/AlgR family response regulator
MTPLRAVIVEDELHAVKRLSMALAAVDGVEVQGVARHGDKGLAMIRRLKPDIVFLDIALPGLSGLDIAGELVKASPPKSDPPVIVFVTAFDRFAVEAFRVAAVDYLLKPAEFSQVAETVVRARARLEARETAARVAALERLIEALRNGERPTDPPAWETELWVADRRGAVRVPVDSVERFEAEGDYVMIHARGGDYLMRDSLHLLEGRLDPARFRRVHRSAVVNLDRIARLDRKISGAVEIVMVSGARVPVGRTYAARVREFSARERKLHKANGEGGAHNREAVRRDPTN